MFSAAESNKPSILAQTPFSTPDSTTTLRTEAESEDTVASTASPALGGTTALTRLGYYKDDGATTSVSYVSVTSTVTVFAIQGPGSTVTLSISSVTPASSTPRYPGWVSGGWNASSGPSSASGSLTTLVSTSNSVVPQLKAASTIDIYESFYSTISLSFMLAKSGFNEMRVSDSTANSLTYKPANSYSIASPIGTNHISGTSPSWANSTVSTAKSAISTVLSVSSTTINWSVATIPRYPISTGRVLSSNGDLTTGHSAVSTLAASHIISTSGFVTSHASTTQSVASESSTTVSSTVDFSSSSVTAVPTNSCVSSLSAAPAVTTSRVHRISTALYWTTTSIPPTVRSSSDPRTTPTSATTSMSTSACGELGDFTLNVRSISSWFLLDANLL